MKTLKKLNTKTKREAFVRAHIQNGLAHQIRLLRKERNWSQAQLAQKIGASNQSAVARLENPAYGRYSLTTILKLADAFDVAALVKFASFSKLLAETADLSPAALRVRSHDEEGDAREATMQSVRLCTFDNVIDIDLSTPPTYGKQPNIKVYGNQTQGTSEAYG